MSNNNDVCPKCKSKLANNVSSVNASVKNIDKSLLVTYDDIDYNERVSINKCPRCKHTWDVFTKIPFVRRKKILSLEDDR